MNNFLFYFSCNRLYDPIHLDTGLPRELEKSLRFLFETRSIFNILAIWRICIRSTQSRTQQLYVFYKYLLAVDMLYCKYDTRVRQHLPVLPRINMIREIPSGDKNFRALVAMCRFLTLS